MKVCEKETPRQGEKEVDRDQINGERGKDRGKTKMREGRRMETVGGVEE